MRQALAFLVLFALCLPGCRDGEGQGSVFKITEEVLVADVMRLGLNLGDDIWYAGAVLTRERLPHGGFEGVLFRQITWGPDAGADWMTDWHQPGEWSGLLPGARARYVSGPRAGQELTIVRLDEAPHPGRPTEPKLPRYVFDSPGPVPEPGDGLLIDASRPETGYVGQHGGGWWVFTEGAARVVTDPTAARPGSRGRCSALLDGREGSAGLLAPALDPRFVPAAGTWRLAFWARGEGEAVAYCGSFVRRGEKGYASKRFTLDDQWRHHEMLFTLDREPQEFLGAGFEVAGGRLWLDEASFVRIDEDGPTVFRPPVLATLGRVRPGVLRHLQIGGSSLANILEPRASRMAFSSSRGDPPPDGTWPGHPDARGRARTHSYGLHEFLELCEAVGAAPWYCVPGTFTEQEMAGLVEYLAGPADAPWGKVRERRGRSAPWTDAFESIRIEIGNEAWNEAYPFQLGGYSHKGEYWERLFRAAKASPYWSGTIRLLAAGQAVNPEFNARLAAETPQADGFAVAPYILHGLSGAWAGGGDEELFARVMGAPLSGAGLRGPRETAQALAPSGRELCVYEVNHHVTGGDASQEDRNKVAAGLGGGLNVVSWMLELLSRFGARAQCLFTLAQFEQPLDGGNAVRLWGGVVSMEPGRERWRPTLMALELANRMLGGDMVRVVSEGDLPARVVEADFGAGPERVDLPYLRCFATRDGDGVGAVLFNMHPWSPLPVTLRLAASRELTGRMAVLSGPDLAADNEPEHEVRVVVVESDLRWPEEGLALELAPHSMTVVTGGRVQ